MPAAAFKVDVMAAKRAEHQGTIAAHYTNLEHPAVVGRHRKSADDFEPEPAQNPGATATTAADVDVDADGAVGSQSRSRSSQKKSKRHAVDVDTDMHDQQKLGNKGRLRNAEGTKIDAVASEGPGSGSASALERSWVPDIVGSGGTGRFRDEDFYLSAQRPDRHAEEGYAIAEKGRGALEANVLDLMGEDNAALVERKRKVWDNKKKRYVTLQKVRAQYPASF
jgi:hypothetical protein